MGYVENLANFATSFKTLVVMTDYSKQRYSAPETEVIDTALEASILSGQIKKAQEDNYGEL